MDGRDEKGRFAKGKYKGGPGRPPKEQCVTDVLRNTVDVQTLVDKLIEIATEKGDIQALKYAIDRLDGKPRETVHNINETLPDVVEIDLSDDKADTGDAPAVEE